MAVVNKDIWAEVKELFLEQYRADLTSEITAHGCSLPEGAKNRFQGFVKAVIDTLVQPLDDAVISMQSLFDVDSASGEWLDVLGKLVHLKRNANESDSSFRNRIKAEFGHNNAGTPDGVVYSSAMLSADPKPQYMDEAPATFFVYTGPFFDGDEWKEGGRQLTRMQVKKLAPAGALGLPGMCIGLADGTVLGTYAESEKDRKLLLVAGNDSHVEREVLLADNLGNIVVTPQSVPVRVKLQGSEVPNIPTIETEWQGVPVDAVRIKDLPDAGDLNSYMVRDSDSEGTVKTQAMNENTLDELWNTTPPEGE